MSKTGGQPSANAFSGIVDLLVEHEMKLDAVERVLKEINPIVHELYLGTIENLRTKKAAELKKTIAARFKSKPAES